MENIKTKINNIINKYKYKNNLIEFEIADFSREQILINKKYRQLLNFSVIGQKFSYNSADPTLRIKINDIETEVSYSYDNKTYKNILPFDTNYEIISNFLFFHDLIFGYILNQYSVNINSLGNLINLIPITEKYKIINNV
jgi:hypothetical protein